MLRSCHRQGAIRQPRCNVLLISRHSSSFKRVLAIESSCDDTAVAVADYWAKEKGRLSLHCRFHEKVTADNDAFRGIHPMAALDSHRTHMAPLIEKALQVTGEGAMRTPDFVAVTRGPGMRSNLSVGLDMAKGLALAWNVPLLGVHHMQAHALTPRLVSVMVDDASEPSEQGRALTPEFPFLSVLVSGGHTLLLDSNGLLEHRVLAQTHDIAIGDCLDKAARAILPPDLLKPPFGRALEKFAFHSKVVSSETTNKSSQTGRGEVVVANPVDYAYEPPSHRRDEIRERPSKWGWTLAPPLRNSKGGEKSSRRMLFSFSGLLSSVVPLGERDGISLSERQAMAREVQRVAFEHLASRIIMRLSDDLGWRGDTIVVSGGVASNGFLRHVLRATLDVRGFGHIKLCFPPSELCTDNALMIAWAGIEMYEAGYRSSLDIHPMRKWSMDSTTDADDDGGGGILGSGGWFKTDSSHLNPP